MGNPKQQSSTTQGMSSLSNMLGASASGGTSSVTPNENPLITQFRESEMPAIAAQYNLAQQPVYGPQQIAQQVSADNATANAAQTGEDASLARRGAANSGNAVDVSNSINNARTGQISNFVNSVPLLNEQNKFNQTQGVLSSALGLTGQSPIGSTTVGTNTGNTSSEGSQIGTGSSAQYGPSFLNSLLGDVQGLGGLAAGSFFGGK